jgi:hypothetical protein
MRWQVLAIKRSKVPCGRRFVLTSNEAHKVIWSFSAFTLQLI